MSFGTLWVGVSGLTAAQRAMEVTANNVANVNTEGYSRQRVELTSGRPVPGTYGSRGDGMRGRWRGEWTICGTLAPASCSGRGRIGK